MVLPHRVKPEQNPQPGHDPGAPHKTDLGKKIKTTTGIAVVVWIILYCAVQWSGISFHQPVKEFIHDQTLSK